MPKEIDIAVLRELLAYDPESGSLKWKERAKEHFLNAKRCASWNSRWAGLPALCTKSPRGYLSGEIFAAHYKAHRVAWALHYGEWPKEQIDHINHDKADNRISNLRVVSQAENSRNKPAQKNNKSGCIGVSWYRNGNKWVAGIGAGKKRVSLGYFKNFDDAVAARRAAEQSLNYHKNHGRN